MLTQAGEQDCRLTVVHCGLRISIAMQVQAAKVLADSGSCAHVADRKQLFLCGLSACCGLVMLTQHGQRHDLGNLGLRSGIRQTRMTEGCLGRVEKNHSFSHLAAQYQGYAPSPIRKGLNLARLCSGHASHKKTAHRLRRTHGPWRLTAPGFVTQVFQGPGKRERAFPGRLQGYF